MNEGFEYVLYNIPIDWSFISACAYKRNDTVLGKPTL